MYINTCVTYKNDTNYFNSTRIADQILARVAKSIFTTADIIDCQETLDCDKIISRFTKLDKATWKVCAPLDIKKTESVNGNITLDGVVNPSAKEKLDTILKRKHEVQKGREKDAKIPFKKRRVTK